MSLQMCDKCERIVDTEYEEIHDSLLGGMCAYCVDQVECDIDESKLED